MLGVTWSFAPLKSSVYFSVVCGKSPWFANWHVVIGTLETEIATVEVDLYHASVFHEGDDLGMFPIRATFRPFDDNTHGDNSMIVAKLDKVNEVAPDLLQQFLMGLYLCFTIWVVPVYRVPRRAAGTRDRRKNSGRNHI